jgi:hypothetical protein
MIDTRGFHDDSSLHGVQLFCFFNCQNGLLKGFEIVVNKLEGLGREGLVWQGNRHVAEIRAHVDTDRDKHFLQFDNPFR